MTAYRKDLEVLSKHETLTKRAKTNTSFVSPIPFVDTTATETHM